MESIQIKARIYRIDGSIYYEVEELLNTFEGETRREFSRYMIGKTLTDIQGNQFIFEHDVLKFLKESTVWEKTKNH